MPAQPTASRAHGGNYVRRIDPGERGFANRRGRSGNGEARLARLPLATQGSEPNDTAVGAGLPPLASATASRA